MTSLGTSLHPVSAFCIVVAVSDAFVATEWIRCVAVGCSQQIKK